MLTRGSQALGDADRPRHLIGMFFGLIPGIGTILPTIVSYAVEKRVSRHPEQFGAGAIEGVAGPEATNNAYANGALIPLFTLGVPASPTIAVLLGAFMMNGLTPGPFLFQEKPDFVWASSPASTSET